MKKITLLFTFLAFAFSYNSYAQFGCATGVAITDGYTASGITTPGTAGVEDWNDNPTVQCGTTSNSYWDDDVYLFTYTAGATDEEISMTTFSRSSWNGIGIFATCTGTALDGCLATEGTTSSDATKTVTANIAAGQTVYIASGQWGTPNNLDFDVTAFSAIPLVNPPNCDATLTVTTDVPAAGDISWSAATGAPTSYDLTVGTSSGGSETLATTDIGNVLTYNLGVLAYSTTYYVNLVPKNGNGSATGCVEQTFVTQAQPAAGTDCLNPITVSALPYNTTDDTANYGDVYSGSPGATGCGTTSTYLNGDDVVYAYTAAADGNIKISMSTIGSTYSGVFVYTDCADIGTACVAGYGNGNSTADYDLDVAVTNGTTYYVIISTWATPQSTTYTLDITEVLCADPSGMTATTVTTTTADLTWTENGSATAWNLEWNAGADFAPGTGAESGSDTAGPTATYSATGLTAATTYYIYYQSDCSGSTSEWVGPFIGTTECDTFTAPYTQDFENAGTIPTCWSMSGSENWLFSTTGGHVGNAGTITGTTTSGGYFAYVDDSTPDNTGTTLMSPFVDVSGLTAPTLSFFEISDNEGFSNVTLTVDVWDGASWNNVGTYNTNTAGWEQKIIDLSGLTITGPVQARFVVDELPTGDFYDDVAIDDVTFDEAPSCINATVTYTVVDDCATSGGFLIDIEVTDMGTATDITVSNDQDATTHAVTAIGTVQFGPYTNLTDVIVTVVDDNNASCTQSSTAITQTACPPANNLLANAIAVTCGETVTGTTIAATQDEASAPDTATEETDTLADNDSPWVWYSFTGTGTPEEVTLSNCGSTVTNFDTEIFVFTGTSGALTCIDDGYDECGSGDNYAAETTFTSDGTTTYYIAVGGYNSTDIGDFELSVACVTLGLEDNVFAGFKYFPNPVEGTLSLRAQDNMQNVAVLNMLGQEVMNISPNAISSELNMSALSRGTYFVRVNINGAIENFKIIKE